MEGRAPAWIRGSRISRAESAGTSRSRIEMLISALNGWPGLSPHAFCDPPGAEGLGAPFFWDRHSELNTASSNKTAISFMLSSKFCADCTLGAGFQQREFKSEWPDGSSTQPGVPGHLQLVSFFTNW